MTGSALRRWISDAMLTRRCQSAEAACWGVGTPHRTRELAYLAWFRRRGWRTGDPMPR